VKKRWANRFSKPSGLAGRTWQYPAVHCPIPQITDHGDQQGTKWLMWNGKN
jgi:hypothetical protein